MIDKKQYNGCRITDDGILVDLYSPGIHFNEESLMIDHDEFEYFLDRLGVMLVDEKIYLSPTRGVVHEEKYMDYWDFIRSADEDLALDYYVERFIRENRIELK